MPNIRILLIDSLTLFRQGMRALLQRETDMEVVGESSDAADAMEKVIQLQPDLVLMDIELDGIGSFDLARQIHNDHRETKVAFLTLHDDEDSLQECMKTGVAGYILKSTDSGQLCEAVRDIAQGGKYLSPTMLTLLVSDLRARSTPGGIQGRAAVLTQREKEVLKMVAEGRSVKEVAWLLHLSNKTVEAHKFNLMRKLNIHNKAQLVTYAFQKKILRLPAMAS